MTTRTYLSTNPNIKLITNGLNSYRFLEGKGLTQKIKMFKFDDLNKSIEINLGTNNSDAKYLSVVASGTGQLVVANNLLITSDINGINLYFKNQLEYTFKSNSSNVNFISLVFPQLNNKQQKLLIKVNHELYQSNNYINESLNTIIIGKSFNGYIGGINYDNNSNSFPNTDEFIIRKLQSSGINSSYITPPPIPTTTPPMTTSPMTTPPMTTPPMTTSPMTTPPMTTPPMTTSPMTTSPMTTPSMTTSPMINEIQTMTTSPLINEIQTMTTAPMTTPPWMTNEVQSTTTTPWMTNVILPTPSPPSGTYNPMLMTTPAPTTPAPTTTTPAQIIVQHNLNLLFGENSKKNNSHIL